MSELDALLEAIYASPDDDAPRLVYADALLERGDFRGELIVRQCRGDSATDLTEPFGDRWLSELAEVISTYTYERGFLATASLRQPRDPAAIAKVIGHPLWRTVRVLQGSLAIALDPSMTALRVLHVKCEPAWRELFTGTPRPITELHYQPNVVTEWDQDGDITATPQSGGTLTRSLADDEIAAIASCSALPSLQRLVIVETPELWFTNMLRDGLLDRVPIVESRNTMFHLEISRGVAAFTLPPAAPSSIADTVLGTVRELPPQLEIELHAPRFSGRARIEHALGRRLRR